MTPHPPADPDDTGPGDVGPGDTGPGDVDRAAGGQPAAAAASPAGDGALPTSAGTLPTSALVPAQATRSGGGGDALGGTIRRTELPSGLRIITEAVPSMRSVAIGVWVAAGSRDEDERLNGVSHFLEHLLFKGTKRRSALDISAEIEAVGGETNAFTSKEYTCFYARVLDEDLALAVDVMMDLLANSVFEPADVETERGVILEEIAMHDDEPGDEVHDLFAEAVYGTHPLGRLISGTAETIAPMTRQQIVEFYRRRYVAPALVITAAGNLDHDTVIDLVTRAVTGTSLDTPGGTPLPLRPAAPGVPVRPAAVTVRGKDTEQAHLVLGCPALHRRDERRFALGVLNNLLGGGMSSRLFQEIRERRGLAYSVYSYTSLFADSGLFAVYAGCAPGKAGDVLDLIRTLLADVARDGVSEAEVARGKGMLKGSLVLGLEDTGSRMSQLGKGELLYDEQLSVDDLLARVDAVTVADVNSLAAQLLMRPMSLAVVGPFDGDEFTGTP